MRLWLELRTDAWARGRAFESVQVTPNYLQQIATDWCPVTRVALDQNGEYGCQRSIDAYFSPSWTVFQADRGRDFSVNVDGVSA